MFLGVFQLNALNNVVLMRKVKSQTVLRIFLSRSRSLLINILYISLHLHFVKSVQIRSYFCSEYRKIRTRNNSVFGHFSQSADRSHEGAYNKYPTNFFTSNYDHKSSKEKEKQLSKKTVIGPYNSESSLKHGTTINLC